MGCLVNLIKIILGLIMIIIMLIVGVKLVFDPYVPEKHNTAEYYQPTEEYKTAQSNDDYDVPVQTGSNHDYIMENTFQKGYVVMELTPQLEAGLVYVIKVFKSQFGPDFTPTIISAHDSFDRHDQWSKHRVGKAVDISMVDISYYKRKEVVSILEKTLPKDYSIRWENQYSANEHLHFQSKK